MSAKVIFCGRIGGGHALEMWLIGVELKPLVSFRLAYRCRITMRYIIPPIVQNLERSFQGLLE
jgi:hypothetical protein